MAEDGIISFTVHTHEHKERSNDWYWALGLTALVGAVAAVFFSNPLLAVIILVGAFSIGVLILRGPRLHGVHIDNKGISLDGTLYPYRSLESFWVEETSSPRLLVTTSGILHPQLVLSLEDAERAARVRAHLRRFIEEKEQHPHLGEYVAEIFGL